MSAAPPTVGTALAQAAHTLEQAGVPEARLEAQLLLVHATGLDRPNVLAHPEARLEPAANATFRELVERRAGRVPLAYLTGWREFFRRRFRVSPAVLIPRPESELLVELALRELARFAGEARPRMLDLGTGSGILAVTIALEAPRARVFASDLSLEALRLAAENAERLGAGVRFFQADLLGPVRTPLDLIIANLPYVSRADVADAAPEVREHEPELALLGGERGTELLERLLPQLRDGLRPGGVALLEIGWLQGAPMRRKAEAAVPGAEVTVLRDQAGLDRLLRIARG